MAWTEEADPQTYAVIGAALAVRVELGPDFLEIGYAKALELEFQERSIPYEREVPVPMIYRGKPLGVPFRVDFVCFGDIMLEIKSIPRTGQRERRQLIHYLKASGFERGLLLNFGDERLQIERAVGPRRLAKLSPDSVFSPAPQTEQPQT
ncbi:MAG: GxxExxY protein [Candidatus Thermoplasmatota archaeon]